MRMKNPIVKEEKIGDCRLILGDCMEVMPTLGKVDAVLTDPPYGIGISKNPVRQKHKKSNWDNCAPSNDVLLRIQTIAKQQIIWGGNYFNLPPSRGFFVWDKIQPENFSLAMCEQAWWSKDANAKIFCKSVLSYKKQHPTQKPVELMEWCIGHLPKDTETILDPFMGSGTTLVACAKLGRSGIGIELDEDYFNIACERVEKAYSQADLFVAPPENKDIKRNQVSMFDDGDAA